MNNRFRLTRSTEFKRVRRLGKSYAHPLLILLALPNNLDHPRVGVAASKSVGGAVQRNRAKRLLRAAIIPLLPEITTGYDLVLLARKPILALKSQMVQAALIESLKRANILQHDH